MKPLNCRVNVNLSYAEVLTINALLDRNTPKPLKMIEGIKLSGSCPECGQTLIVEVNYCSNCGQKIDRTLMEF